MTGASCSRTLAAVLSELTVRHLLLASWELPPGKLARALPSALEPALLEGGLALLSIAFLRNDDVRIGRFGAPSFSQVNVRTYVDGPAGPGIFFLSIRVGLAGLGAAVWGVPARPARILVGEGFAEAPGLGCSFRYRREGAVAAPLVGGVAVGDQQSAYLVSAGVRRIAAEHPRVEWETAELVGPPRFELVLALGFDVGEPDLVLYAPSTPFRIRLPPERVA
jgi:hypothetical protein